MRQLFATRRDGLSLAYGEAGPQDGETVVLCHGLAAGGAQFRADADYFAALSFRVLVPDLRGHGASPAAKSYDPANYAIPVMADDLIAMLDAAGADRVHWVGNSLGGILAFDLIGRFPERFASLATFGTAHALGLPGAAARAIPLLYGALGKGFASWSTAMMTTRNKAARPLVEKLLRQFDPKVGEAIAQNVRRYDLTANALAFPGPMLLMRGGRDVQVNLALARTLPRFAGRPNFTLVELREGGHCANLDATDEWRAALLSFWRR
ncbi:alpha/beta fold hydrolase [Devosia geojensis]|uniref:alpha/beta fold hydrolase n=1 Tax=Devosia geojensis TaxID=443610 RepID=UPI000696975A|nr:alpha/beta fold hydrolase [Devosia geojensis]